MVTLASEAAEVALEPLEALAVKAKALEATTETAFLAAAAATFAVSPLLLLDSEKLTHSGKCLLDHILYSALGQRSLALG